MRHNRSALVTALLFVVALTRAGAHASPKDVIRRAIQAHGGATQIAKLRVARVHLKGYMFDGAGRTPITVDDAWQLPNLYRTQTRIEANGATVTQILTISGDSGWISQNGMVQDMSHDAVLEMKEQVYCESFDKLFPLLDVSSYRISPLPDAIVAGKRAHGLQVAATGHRPVSLFFYVETGLLAKRAEKMGTEGGKEVLREVLFGDYKSSGGVKKATKMSAFYDGKLVVEGTGVETTVLAKQDPSLFRKP